MMRWEFRGGMKNSESMCFKFWYKESMKQNIIIKVIVVYICHLPYFGENACQHQPSGSLAT